VNTQQQTEVDQGLERARPKCPRHSAALLATLTAAACGALTGFTGPQSEDLGHGRKMVRTSPPVKKEA